MKCLIFLSIVLGLVGCKEDEEPTSFSGLVIYNDGTIPTDGFIQIFSDGKDTGFGVGPNSIDSKRGEIDINSNRFDLFFDGNDDVISYTILFFDKTINDGYNSGSGLDCGVIPCDEIAPGKAYTDLLITVPNPK